MKPEEIPVVVDANILFSALLRPGNKFIAALTTGRRFYVSETTLAEIFRHKEKIVSTTHLNQDELAKAYHAILVMVEIFREGLIPDTCWKQAADLCRGVDLNDTPPVALTLALDGLLWTGDKALKAGLMAKGFDRFFSP